MAEITRRRTGELLRKLFEILIQHPDGMQAREALDALASSVQLTDHEKGSYRIGGRRFEKIVRFATIDCVKAGWLLKAKGTWSLSEAGKDAYRTYRDPEEFYRAAVKLYHEWKASQPASAPAPMEVEEAEDAGKAASITFEEAEEQAWAEIEQYLRGMNPYDFQELVAGLIQAMGYHVSWIAPPGKDGGIDIVAGMDPLRTRPPTIKIQVKRQKEAVRVDGLRSFMALLGEGDVGLFVSTGGFTKDARDEARIQEKRKVTLLDLEAMFNLWVEHYGKLTDEARRKLPLKAISFLAPEQ